MGVALGARRADVSRMIVSDAIRLLLPGIALGTRGALGLTRFLRALLYGVTPTDPATFVQLTTVMLAVGVAAAYLYPADFRHEMGDALVETYRDRCRAASRHGGVLSLTMVWLRALSDSLRNGLGERLGWGKRVGWEAATASKVPTQAGKSGRLHRSGTIARGSGSWRHDVVLVMRRLAHTPLFAAMMVGTLTAGLGAFAVVYTAVYKVLIEPLPYERPDDLYYVWRDYGPIFDLNRGWLGGRDIAALDTAGGVIEATVGLDIDEATLAGTADAEPEEIRVLESTPDLFEMRGVSPMVGRGFTPDEVGPGRNPVVVLDHDLWTARFGGDASIIGSEIRLDGEPFRVIGVMRPGFRFVMHTSLGSPERADAYITFDFHLAEVDPGPGNCSGLIRARPGTSPEHVAAAVGAVGASIDERFFDGRGLSLYPVGVRRAAPAARIHRGWEVICPT